MDTRLFFKDAGFLLVLVIGIPGNIFILSRFTFLRIIEKKLLPANIILMDLSLANLLVLLSRVIPPSLEAIGLGNLLSDVECKLVIYTYRVSRAMSISITSLLSCHQCILITPNTGVWSYLKLKLKRNINVIILILWISNIIFHSYTISITRAKGNFTSSPYTQYVMYCNVDFSNYFSYILNGAFTASRDYIFVGLMTAASTYIVYLLLSHKKSIKNIRSSDKKKRKSAELKASRAVILLVSLYVALFGFDICIWFYILTMSKLSSDMNETRILLACSYSALSPLVIIATNPKLQQRMQCSPKNKSLLQNSSGDEGNVYSIS